MFKFLKKRLTSQLSELSGLISRNWRIVKTDKLAVGSLLIIMAIGALLRFYQIRDGIVFLGDEGRDALAVKRIVLDLRPTLLGPTASVGGFYLGPVYYYFIAPFFVLFGMDPVGGAVFVALASLLTIVLAYIFSYRLWGVIPATTVGLILATAPGIIRFSRSSWNPNPIPLFVMITLISLYLAVARKRQVYLVIAGVSLGIIIQLHYLGLILMGVVGFMGLVLLPRKLWVKSIISGVAGWLLGASMYLLFELRHGFPNIKSVFEFVTRSNGATGPKSTNLPWLFYEANRFNIEAVLGGWSVAYTPLITGVLLLGLGLVLLTVGLKKKKLSLSLKLILGYFLLTSLGLMMYRGQWHYHYFAIMFLSPVMAWGMVVAHMSKQLQKLTLAVIICLAPVLVWQAPTWKPGSKLLDQTAAVSTEVIKFAQNQPFNFALITDGNSDHAYRYFLEIGGAKPTPLEQQVEEQLIVVCEKYPATLCKPLGHPIWEIAGFGRAEIVGETTVYPFITIYRLVHHQESIDMIGLPARQGG